MIIHVGNLIHGPTTVVNGVTTFIHQGLNPPSDPFLNASGQLIPLVLIYVLEFPEFLQV